MKYSKIIVAAVVMLNVVFTAAVLVVALKGAITPDSLIVSWFSFTTVEVWSCASIRKAKMKRKDDGNGEIDK